MLEITDTVMRHRLRPQLVSRPVLLLLLSLFLTVGMAEAQVQEPALPTLFVDTAYNPASAGNIVRVPSGGNLQQAVNAAQPGDTLELEAGAIFRGTISFPKKIGTGWITIRSSRYAELPKQGIRIGPEHSALMPRIESQTTSPAITAGFGAHHYRFVGVEVTSVEILAPQIQYSLITLGTEAGAPDPTAVDQLTDYIIFDRCYIHGTKRGNLVNALNPRVKTFAVVDSYISEAHSIGAPESQTIQIIQATGPIKIANNYLSSAGIGVIFGGGGGGGPTPIKSPSYFIPSNIEVKNNYFFKPLTWKKGDPAFEGIEWQVKNQFELKFGRKVLVEGNVIENNWLAAQRGFAILFTPRDESVEDVTFRNNVIMNSDQGFQIVAANDDQLRVKIENNLVFNTIGTGYSPFEIGSTSSGLNTDLAIEKNTFVGFAQTSMSLIATPPAVTRGRVWNNIFDAGKYNFAGDSTALGFPSISKFISGYDFNSNLLVGSNIPFSAYQDAPSFVSFKFDTSFDRIGFKRYPSNEPLDYALQPTSPYASAGTNGQSLGVDIDRLVRATACARSGQCGTDSVAPAAPTRFLAR